MTNTRSSISMLVPSSRSFPLLPSSFTVSSPSLFVSSSSSSSFYSTATPLRSSIQTNDNYTQAYNQAQTTRGYEPLLFTPGPLTTSKSTKAAMLHDLGSRDPKFLRIVKEVREHLLSIGGVSQATGYECILMQGSGTFGVESTIGTVLPRTGATLLVVINGAYGERMVSIAKTLGIMVVAVRFPEHTAINVSTVIQTIKDHNGKNPSAPITHVATVHHETTAGVLNDIHSLGTELHNLSSNLTFIVDSMSAFGAYPVNLKQSFIHYLVSSSNKCIEGVPGFSFILAERNNLKQCSKNARSVALDAYAQWHGFETNQGQFRFTPPTHSLLAFRQALTELEAEGGANGRLQRYQTNHRTLITEMKKLGFSSYVDSVKEQGCIITTFLVPNDKKFKFSVLYNELEKKGYVIYPGKTTVVESFRLGTIGQLYPQDIKNLVDTIKHVLEIDLGIQLPTTQIERK